MPIGILRSDKKVENIYFRKSFITVRKKLLRAMTQTSARLKAIGIVPWLDPQAGIFLWCRLPEGVDAADVAREVLAEKIVLAPGNAFSLSQSADRFLRFNVAQSLDERLFEILDAAVQKQEKRNH